MVTIFRRFRPPPDPLPVSDEPDAVLVARAQRDHDAFAALYLRYVEEIGRFCYVRLHDAEAARDATQQVFAQAFAALPRYQESGQFRAWLYTIARHVLSNTARQRRPALTLENVAGTVDTSPLPEDVASAAWDRRVLTAAIARLPDDQRLAVELRLAGLSGREVAAAMGRSHDAVRKLQLRAIERLRMELGAGGDDPERDRGA